MPKITPISYRPKMDTSKPTTKEEAAFEITLDHSFIGDSGDPVQTLYIREPNVPDSELISFVLENDGEATANVVVLSRLSGYSLDAIRRMKLSDFHYSVGQVTDFFINQSLPPQALTKDDSTE